MTLSASTKLVTAGVTVAFALLALGGLMFLKTSRHVPVPRPIATLPEAPRPELHLRQGRLHRGQESNPFTGWMVERYENGGLRSRSAISNGLFHGLSQGWHTNGQTQVREQFQAGTSHGLRTKYYPDGSKLSEATIMDGKLEGTFRKWHLNGRLAESVELKGGVPHGISTAYFLSGSLKTRATLQNGKVIETQSWADGEFQLSASNG